jgi:hypothetical protein
VYAMNVSARMNIRCLNTMANILILKSFSCKKRCKNWQISTKNTASHACTTKMDNIGVQEKCQFCPKKLVKIAEYSDHKMDPRSGFCETVSSGKYRQSFIVVIYKFITLLFWLLSATLVQCQFPERRFIERCFPE